MPTKKKPAACKDEDFDWEQVMGADAFKHVDDAEGATEHDDNDTATEVEEPLDVAGLLDHLDDVMHSQDSDGTGNSPMVDVVKLLLHNMPTATCTNIMSHLKFLFERSATQKLKIGSGCSGSGLDWHVVQALVEVLYACSVCMLLVMSS